MNPWDDTYIHIYIHSKTQGEFLEDMQCDNDDDNNNSYTYNSSFSIIIQYISLFFLEY